MDLHSGQILQLPHLEVFLFSQCISGTNVQFLTDIDIKRLNFECSDNHFFSPKHGPQKHDQIHLIFFGISLSSKIPNIQNPVLDKNFNSAAYNMENTKGLNKALQKSIGKSFSHISSTSPPAQTPASFSYI